MALFRPGVLVQTVSGDIGGVSFVQGKGGAYVRRRGVKCNQNSFYQERQRARFSRLPGLWQDLSAQDKTSWATLAARVYRVDRLGVQKPWTARNLFFSENGLRLTAGLSPISAAPIGGARLAFASFTVTYASAVLTLRCNRVGGVGSGRALFFGCRSFSRAGFTSKTFYTFLSSPFSSNLVVNGTSFFAARFRVPDVGEYLGFRVVAIFDGQLTGPIQELIITRSS